MWIIELLRGIVFVAALPAAAVVFGLVLRRRFGVEVLARHNEVAGFIYAVLGVVYAVLLGFTAIIVWEQFRHAEHVVEREANALGDLYRNAQVFPADVRKQVESQVSAYARLVVENEWPAMAEGKESPKAWETYNQLWRTYQDFKPQDDHQRVWYSESVRRLNELGDQRRDRLVNAHAAVPGIIWVVLLGAGAITIGFTFLFGTPNAWAHGLMIFGLAITIGVVLLSIVALEHPFGGITRVKPEAFEQLQKILDVWSKPGTGRGP